MFLMAEFDNFRKRTIREKGEIIRNASEKVLSGLLPIVDDFERGIEANRNSSDADAVKEGMELIYNKLVRYLEQNGVKAIESNGTEFNSDIHEAIAMVRRRRGYEGQGDRHPGEGLYDQRQGAAPRQGGRRPVIGNYGQR